MVGLRRGAVAAFALVGVMLPCAAATAEPAPTPGFTLPTDDEVSEAEGLAATTAKEVAALTAKVAAAEKRLAALQRQVSDAVTAKEKAQEELVDAESKVRQASIDLRAAHVARDDADASLSGTAAEMYMTGTDFESLTTLMLSPPNVMSDLAMVLDDNETRARAGLDAANAAAMDATAREQLLLQARNDHDALARDAAATLAAAEKAATKASAEAAKLGAEQERLTARLAELEGTAADLASMREAAARLGLGSMVGLSSGPGPKAAQEIARSMMKARGWDGAEFTCLVALWHAESGWNWSATNPSSGAYGIPQSLPGWKMAAAGSDWLTNPATQITWGMDYISDVYKTPCGAYEKFLSRSPHWY